MEDFRRVRRLSTMQELVYQLKGKSSSLLSYDDVVQKLKGQEESIRELKDIELKAIKGSVGRYKDFNRRFLPRNSIQYERWARVKMAMTGLKGVPPIEVYQIGDVYFVKDGNHRVSVAQEIGFTHFQAYVTKVRTKVPLTLNTEPDELIIKAELADFLDKTKLDQLRPNADLTVTIPGQYEVLLEHITVHRYYMGIDEDRAVSYADAVGHWYDILYLPVVEIIAKRKLLQEFSARTETDLYLYITKHRCTLEKTLGWEISTETAAEDIEPRSKGYRPTKAWRPKFYESQALLKDQIIEHSTSMFADILVAIDGDESGWISLNFAALIAKRENARNLQGLHVVPSPALSQTAYTDALKNEFSKRCFALHLKGQLAIEVGERIPSICKRARYTDLTILKLASTSGVHKPNRRSRLLGNGLSTLIRSCPRSVLVVSSVESRLDRLLLAYDGSELAAHALNIAAYFARRWKIKMAVLTVHENHSQAVKIQQCARQLLASHNVGAVFIINTTQNVVDSILHCTLQQQSNLILMGAHGLNAPWYRKVGSAVAKVLQKSSQPVLICR